MKRVLLLFLIQLSVLDAFSQLDNSLFDHNREVNDNDSTMLNLGFNILGFNKNNEYFNDIADGFTLFGYQINPYLNYQPTTNFRIDAGVYMEKDFGASGYRRIQPTFTAKYKHHDASLIFGTLEGASAHQLVEPLYDFERILLNRIENGLQFKLENEKLFLDTWVDWQNMIYEGDNDQEEVTGGLSFDYQWSNGKVKLYSPVQFLVFHRGGQIDTSPDPLQTYVNTAIGLKAVIPKQGFIKSINFQSYYLYHTDYASEQLRAFKNGSGIYLNASIKTKINLEVMASYWKGDEFISIMGGQLYPSISSNFKKPNAVEKERELLIFRFMHTTKVSDNIHISSRFEPHLRLTNSKFEFSHAFYLFYTPNFFLTRKKDK